MDIIADGRLAAAVGRAGGFGIIGAGYGDQAWLERQLDEADETPIGVGFITWSLAVHPELLDVALNRRPTAIMLSFGDFAPFVDKIKRSSALIIAQVQTLEQAKNAIAKGADILVAQGAEAGGHGIARGTLALVPAVVDIAHGIPVVAAGGVADGRGLAAALMLGAEGVLMGTRFYATVESAASPRAKRRIVDATGDETVRGTVFDIARRIDWPTPYTGRVLRNKFAKRWHGREAELLQHQDEETKRYAEARANGDFDIAGVFAGEAVDLITDVPQAREIVERIVRDAEQLLAGALGRYRIALRPSAEAVNESVGKTVPFDDVLR
ncbi:MAG: nitronate monooxygenase [Candidatus Velthaea sp.]